MSTHALIATVVLAAAVATADEPATRPDDPIARREAALIGQLASPDDAVREEAAYWLHYHRTERAFDALFRVAMSDPSETLRWDTADWLDCYADCPTDLLLRKIEAGEPAVRRLAVRLVQGLDEPKVKQAVIRAMDDPDAGVRLSALDRSSYSDQLAVVPVLARLMTSDVDPDVRSRATEILQQKEGKLLPELLGLLLAHPRSMVRRSAVGAMADAGAEPSGALLAALADPAPLVRLAAVEAIGKCKHCPLQVQALLAALHDSAPGVAGKATEGLLATKDAQANAQLAALLADDPPAETRYAIDRARAPTLSGAEAVRLYAKLLGQCEEYEDWGLRRELAHLATMDASVLSELPAALADRNARVRVAAVEAIREAGDASMAPHLRRVLAADASPDVRVEAVRALAKVEGSKAFATILSAMADANDDVAGAAVAALRETGDPRATDAILGALASDRGAVSGAAVYELEHIQDARALKALRAELLRRPEDQWLQELAVRTLESHSPADSEEAKALRDTVLQLVGTNTSGLVGERLADVLAMAKDETSAAALVRILGNEDALATSRAEAARTLGKWKHAPAVPALMAALAAGQDARNDFSAWLAREAIKALSLIGDRRAVPALAKLIIARDPYEQVVGPARRTALRLDADAAVEAFLAAFGRYPEAAREAMREAVFESADFGFDADRWRRWWAENRQDMLRNWKERCDDTD